MSDRDVTDREQIEQIRTSRPNAEVLRATGDIAPDRVKEQPILLAQELSRRAGGRVLLAVREGKLAGLPAIGDVRSRGRRGGICLGSVANATRVLLKRDESVRIDYVLLLPKSAELRKAPS